ncbi:hypothetical protein COCVIDRAFT_68479, partial [Bipolaris victoriae FI3]
MSNREESIQSAIRDYHNGVFKSQKAAAAAYGVSRSTLRHRLAGRVQRVIAHRHEQRL